MDTQKQQTKPKKKAVKRKPRKKPAVKKSITQKQTVTQNVKVIVGELKQRRRQERSLFHKQPQRQYQQPPTIIYQQAPVQQVAPHSITPQPQPQQQPQQQPQPQQQTAPITQPTPSPLTQPTAPPQASPVTPTIPTPPPPIQPQTTPPPTIPIPVVPSIEPQDRTVTRPTSPVDPLTRPAPSLSLMEQIQQKAKERADRASTDALTQPPETSRPRPVQALSLQEQIQQKAKERQERVNLGDERKTEVPKGKGSLTSTLPPPKLDLMAEILKKGKELKSVSERKLKPLPPKSSEKQSIVDLLKTNMEGRRKGITGGVGAFTVEGELPKKGDDSGDPDVDKAETESQPAGTAQSKGEKKDVIQPAAENKTTLDDLTGSESPPVATELSLTPTVTATTGAAKKGETIFNTKGEPIFVKGQGRGQGPKKIGIPKEAEQAFNDYVNKYSITKVRNSSSSEAVNGKITTKALTYSEGGELNEDFLELLKMTGDSVNGLKGKLKLANQGKPPQLV
jgi:hypothetical protein